MTKGDTITADIASEIGRILNSDSLGLEDDLIELGATSIDLVEISIALSTLLSREIAINDIWEARTLSALIGRGGGGAPYQALGPVSAPNGRPGRRLASPEQRRFYAMHQPEITPLTELVPCIMPLPGRYDGSVIRDALASIVAKHDSLRMTFDVDAEGIWQVDVDDAQIVLEEVDLRSCADPQAQLDRILAEEDGRRYSPRVWPMFRCHHVRGSESDIVLFHVYHLVFDGASKRILTQELHEQIGLVAGGGKPADDTLTFNYSDYANWANWRTGQESYRRAKEYWAAEFGNAFRPLHLTRTEVKGERDATSAGYVRSLGVATSKEVAALAQSSGTTTFTVLLATFLAYLLEALGRDVALATPSHGRMHPQARNLIGLFMNPVIVCARQGEYDRPLQFLQLIHQRVIGAQDHQEFQYDDMANMLGLPFKLTQLPLTGVYFNNIPETLRVAPTERGAHYDVKSRMKQDLMVFYQQIGEEVVFNFRYRHAALEDEEVPELCRKYFAFLRSFLTQTDTRARAVGTGRRVGMG